MTKKRFTSLYTVLLIILVVAVCMSYGIRAYGWANFVPTNGDYQNYNAIRRVLAGQKPYTEFANYLGVGPLLLTVPFVALNNTLSFSICVSHVIACACYILLVAVLFWLVTGKKQLSVLIGALFPWLVSSRLLAKLPLIGEMVNNMQSLLSAPNNSFRIARMFLPVLQIGILLLLLKQYKRKTACENAVGLLTNCRAMGLLGALIAMGVVWSNDFGIACLGSATLIFVILQIWDAARVRKQNVSAATAEQMAPAGSRSTRFWTILFYCIGMLAGIGLSATIVSGGHPEKYLSFTAQTADWQFWYFGYYEGEKIYGLADFFSPAMTGTLFVLVVYFAAMGYCLYRLCKNKVTDKLIAFVYLYTCVTAAHVLYILGSGGNNFTEGSYGFVFLLMCALLLRGALWLAEKVKAQRLVSVGTVSLAVLYLGYMGVTNVVMLRQISQQNITQDPAYVKQLGGRNNAADQLRAMETVVNGAPVFSTYATALDDMLHRFQPTGSDYIIHALGNDNWDRYQRQFVGGGVPLGTNHQCGKITGALAYGKLGHAGQLAVL